MRFLLFKFSAMEKIAAVLENVNLDGFTELLSGTSIRRYVVAFTHNKERSLELLKAQSEYYSKSFDNITIG